MDFYFQPRWSNRHWIYYLPPETTKTLEKLVILWYFKTTDIGQRKTVILARRTAIRWAIIAQLNALGECPGHGTELGETQLEPDDVPGLTTQRGESRMTKVTRILRAQFDQKRAAWREDIEICRGFPSSLQLSIAHACEKTIPGKEKSI